MAVCMHIGPNNCRAKGAIITSLLAVAKSKRLILVSVLSQLKKVLHP